MVKDDVPLPFNANFVSVCLKKDNDYSAKACRQLHQ